jgi:hypothetical protein
VVGWVAGQREGPARCVLLLSRSIPAMSASAPPAPAPSPAPRQVSPATQAAVTASSSRPSRPRGRFASRSLRRDRGRAPLINPGKLNWVSKHEQAARQASGEAAAAKRQREAQRALIFPTGPEAIAAGTVVSLWLCAILAITALTAVINAAGGTLPAKVWPTGPTGVSFSDAECAELHRLLGLFYNAPGWPYRVGRDGFVRVEWHQFRGWLVGQPPDSELHAAWAAINELLRSKLLAAGILGLFYLACWRVVFRLGDHNPDHQDVEADYDLYAATSMQHLPHRRCRNSRQPLAPHHLLDHPHSRRHAHSLTRMHQLRAGAV